MEKKRSPEMQPEHYVDIEVIGNEKGGGLPRPVVAGAILRVLHGAFRRHPGKFALALPAKEKSNFSCLRVFSQTRSDLDLLVATVESNPSIRDYGRIGYPRVIPEGYDGPWKRYSRFRIPTRKADRDPKDALRARRIAHADKHKLPFFILSSVTSGQRFGLYIEVSPAELNREECMPDSYGLSVSTRPFAVPDLP
jgi:hypothetical protein